MNKQSTLLCVMLSLSLPLNLQAEVRASSNFKMQADGVASAVNMNSSNFKLFSIVGDGRAVNLSSSSHFKLGSSVVYAIGTSTGTVDDEFCFPVRTLNAKVAIICL
jgi:hypothetical protein